MIQGVQGVHTPGGGPPVPYDARSRALARVDVVLVAGGELLGTVAHIAYHHTNPGEGWYPFADEADVPAVIAEVCGHIEHLETAIKKAKADIASVERPARLAAIRRRTARDRCDEPCPPRRLPRRPPDATVEQIADALALSVSTVKRHRRALRSE